jgi:hypothetical protein
MTEQVEPNGEVQPKQHYGRCPLSHYHPSDSFFPDTCTCDQIEANVKKRSEELAQNWLERWHAAGGKGYPRQQLFEEWVIQTLAAITES